MRPTTSYRLAVTGPREHLSHLTDLLVKGAVDREVSIDQSGFIRDRNEAFVRVRVKTDDDAMLALAREIVPSGEFTLTTGYGVHQRVIK
jgi:hypothetical protein